MRALLLLAVIFAGLAYALRRRPEPAFWRPLPREWEIYRELNESGVTYAGGAL